MDKKKSIGALNLFGNQNQMTTPLQQIQSSLEKVRWKVILFSIFIYLLLCAFGNNIIQTDMISHMRLYDETLFTFYNIFLSFSWAAERDETERSA